MAAGLSIIEDFVILALPINGIRKLQIGKGKKITAGLMFSIGSL